MKVLMAGGGTGGHIMPALAVADALRSQFPDVDIRFAGATRGLESNLIPAEGYKLITLPVRGVMGTSGRQRFQAGWALLRGAQQAYRWMGEWRPDVVFATGGYVSPPVCFAAWLRRIPVAIFEPNAIPGRANRWMSHLATEILLGNSMARAMLPRRERVRLTGIPIRGNVLFGNRTRAARMYRLDPDRFTILVLGGSQGAHAINGLVVETIRELGRRDDIQFVLQSGPSDYNWLLSKVRPLPIRTWVRPFIHQMGDSLAVADLVIARAGALTLAELCVTGRPSILIPYPHAADNHQEANARCLEEVGAARVLLSDEVSGLVMAQEITRLLGDGRLLRSQGMMAQKLARFEAADTIARRLANLEGSEPKPKDVAPRRHRRRPRGRA
ncbi:MAG: undecaprenyldiphospho-muramoylpentapeptide beta-N-acetylglucosaminyltransferase [Candidatus Eisenbacteria bacterium]|uniref:UDP-N-acetylglucosamine--N-acetylmuramyl-(pentapeptide) pyrophosphoryl-undecaprenol N-acetylglucosamine transferase n=1 Tax=Eiseniibacteriota bacterium TaxID=2212470 RepID=A0A948W858_UNCEI|nr:undecaprenyldiphospho-muramoylpentapeptide beta-N-acetylglucosaminyltransferase [Candidatus Eisenbacteria bacterium]MBU1947541.1 undecaprenyldiphospho-muramoylpentapeptide beta-N-acetylglucosaminyltransferase [Candidatus Eisenbacteria bacterium]MBU2692965.1 undecaprenyldiphospho-muramoylpentapeptide beta-N-acetylglucosaminyltransferase [Candidatus Eisenbacteria bacterium]